MTVPEMLRLVALVASVGVVVLAGVVIGLYLRVWSAAPSGGRLLPGHIWQIATSHLIYVVAAAVELGMRSAAGTVPSWRTPVYLLAALIGLSALSRLVVYELSRLRGQRSP